MVRIGEHVVVLGASIGGLLAARVLADFYARVTVVERDVLTDEPVARRGAPQTGQPHILLARGGEIIEELFPGVLDEMVSAGAYRWSDGDLSRFHTYFGGHLFQQEGTIPDPASVNNYFATRPFIECHVRRRLRAVPNVTIFDGHDFEDLTVTEQRVTGCSVNRRSDGVPTNLDAHLVVDATGRGSRTPVFLERLGYERPGEDELTVRVAYASMAVRIPQARLHEHLFFRLFEPGRPRGFTMIRCEDDIWMVCACTLGGIAPPTNLAEVLDFAAELAPAHALAALRAAEPLTEVSTYRFPANRWRRYDELRRTPDGLVVLGDAVCSFNPVYGQGMTTASIEALALRDCLRSGDKDLPHRFHRAAAKTIRVAWQTAVGSDLALPEVPGRRSVSMRITNAVTDRVLAAAESDPFVVQEFLRVMGMLEAPGRLLRPSFMLRVAKASRRRVSNPQPVEMAVR